VIKPETEPAENETDIEMREIFGAESGDDDDNFYDAIMDRKHREALNFSKDSITTDDLEREFTRFENEYLTKRVSIKRSVLEFWKTEGDKFPILQKLALITLAAPGTQVSVEGLFSLLKFILNDQRDNLSSRNLDNVLLVRCNFQHLDNEFFTNILNNKR
jgi:hypothetical protein